MFPSSKTYSLDSEGSVKLMETALASNGFSLGAGKLQRFIVNHIR